MHSKQKQMLLNQKISISYIFSKVKKELVYVLIIGLTVYYMTSLFEKSLPEMPIAIPAFIGTAISVILSFKLNQSYDRWWEARKIWGSIVNESRTFTLQLQSFIHSNDEALRRMVMRQIAWCYSLGQSLRGLNAVEGSEHFLSADEVEKIKTHYNKPLAILQLNSNELIELRKAEQLDIFEHIQLNNTMISFSNAMGMAERIKSTVFPATYRIFLHLIIYLFVITLSIALRNIESYFEIPLLLVISSAFFLLERTATHLQDPFENKPTDTAMTTIARNIEINLKQLIGEKEIPSPLQPSTFYSI